MMGLLLVGNVYMERNGQRQSIFSRFRNRKRHQNFLIRVFKALDVMN